MASHDLDHGSPVFHQPKSEKPDAHPEPLQEKHCKEESGGTPTAPNAYQANFPDGGLKAWSVVAGTAGVMFCNFGYANAFG